MNRFIRRGEHALPRSAATIVIGSLILSMALPARAEPSDSGADASSTIDVQVLVRGVALDESGAPVESGVVLTLAEPPIQQIRTLKPGDTYARIPIASTTTDGNGLFTVEHSSTVLLSSLADESDNVDLVTIIFGESSLGAVHYSGKVSQDGRLTMAEPLIEEAIVEPTPEMDGDIVSAAPAPDLDDITASTVDVVENGTSRLVVSMLRHTDRASALSHPPRAEESASDIAAAGPARCTVRNRYPKRVGTVGQMFHNVKGAHSRFIYQQGQRSSLGVAISSDAGWKVSGERTVSNSGTIGFAWMKGKRWRLFRTNFRYDKYLCWLETTPHSWEEMRPVGWTGGAWSTGGTSTPYVPPAKNCVFHQSGTFHQEDRTTPIKWTNGLKVKGIIGIDLSARTGYSSTGRLRTVFKAHRRLCGRNSTPGPAGGDPRLLVVRRRGQSHGV